MNIMSKTAHTLILIIVCIATLKAGTTGKLSGRVIDEESGEPLIGCNIILEGTSLGTATNVDGTYFIINIPPGTYTVKALMIGYTSVRKTEVEIQIDLTTHIDFALTTEVIKGQEVTVVAEKKLIQKDLTATTSIIDANDFKALPVTEISEALELQAGYVDGHLRGGRSGEVAYWIDGVPMTDVYDGGTVVDVNKNAVDEMQLISGAFNAEYGQAMSGIVNIVTKDGSNDFGGSATIYAGDFLASQEEIYMNIEQFNLFTTQNYEANIHGSIIPNKLFFYVNGRRIYYQGAYEGHRIYTPKSYAVTYSLDGENYNTYILGTNAAYDSSVTYSYLQGQGADLTDQQLFASTFQQIRSTHKGNGGDSTFVPMEWNRKNYGQLKLLYKLSPMMKLKYTIIMDDVTYQDYDRAYKLNPDGNLTRNRLGLTQLVQLHHSISAKSFYTIGLTQFRKKYNHRTYTKSEEDQYVHSVLAETDPYSFMTGGTNNNIFSRQTTSNIFKLDLTSQVTTQHLMKAGFEFRQHNLHYRNINLQPPDDKTAINPILEGGLLINPQVFPDSTIHSSSYTYNPIEYSGYIQDKIEFAELIVNAGIRFDYFDPKAKIPADPTDPSIYSPIRPENRYHDLNENGVQDAGEPPVTLSERREYWYQNTSAKWKISPRLGFSFPITARGVIHFSYGHFFQVPRFELLYQNPDYDLGQGTGNVGVVGNPELKPEKTVSGELGLQQQLTPIITMDLTGYFRDIRDLTGTRAEEIVLFGGSAKYSRFENSDFAYIRGIVFSLTLRAFNGWSGSVDYTFQVARGTASDPEQARSSITNNELPEIHLIPLNWDQTHTLNASATYAKKYWGGSFIAQVGSGLPYTPESTEDISTLITNSARKPMSWNVDIRGFYRPPNFLDNVTLFLRVLNVFDNLKQVNVYDDSGRADETIDILRAQKTNPNEAVNTIEEWFNNATFYSNPRRIEIGVTYDF